MPFTVFCGANFVTAVCCLFFLNKGGYVMRYEFHCRQMQGGWRRMKCSVITRDVMNRLPQLQALRVAFLLFL